MIKRRMLGILAAALLAAPAFAQAASDTPSTANAGVLVVAVQPGSPADKAGLARGDIILEANGTTVNDAAELRDALNGITTGATVQLKVRHGDAQKALSLVAGTLYGRPWLGILPQAAAGLATATGLAATGWTAPTESSPGKGLWWKAFPLGAPRKRRD
jgi:membrane-associated protease RseP (regulator of RpoE activity)